MICFLVSYCLHRDCTMLQLRESPQHDASAVVFPAVQLSRAAFSGVGQSCCCPASTELSRTDFKWFSSAESSLSNASMPQATGAAQICKVRSSKVFAFGRCRPMMPVQHCLLQTPDSLAMATEVQTHDRWKLEMQHQVHPVKYGSVSKTYMPKRPKPCLHVTS
jgi:hypothetical protein